MDAFEHTVALILEGEGYWTRTSFKVELTKDEKRRVGRPTTPRWEIDVVAYKPAENLLLAVECKSYLDSPGVDPLDLSPDGKYASRYKLFNDDILRQTVLDRLALQLETKGLVRSKPKTTLVLAAGKVRPGTEDVLRAKLARGAHGFLGPSRIVESLLSLSGRDYENDVATVVAKLICRNQPTI